MQLFYFISLTKLHWKKCKNSKSSKNIAHHNFSLQVWWHKRRTYERTVKICAALTSSKVLIGHLTLLPKRYLRILSSVSVTNFDNYFIERFKSCEFANLIKTVQQTVSIENQEYGKSLEKHQSWEHCPFISHHSCEMQELATHFIITRQRRAASLDSL